MKTFLALCTILFCGIAGAAAAVWLAHYATPGNVPVVTSKIAREHEHVTAKPRTTASIPLSSPERSPAVVTIFGPLSAGFGDSADLCPSPAIVPRPLRGVPAITQNAVEAGELPTPAKATAAEDKSKNEPQIPLSKVLDVIKNAVRDHGNDAKLAAAASAGGGEPLTPPPPAPITPSASPTNSAPAGAAPPARTSRSSPQVTNEGDNRLTLHLVDSDIREVLQVLSRASGIAIMPSDSVTGTVSASLPKVDFETALNAILKAKGLVSKREGDIIYVGTADDFKKREVASGKIATRLYRPNYVSAAELQKLITPLLTPQVGTITVTSPSQVGIASDSSSAGGDSYANSDVVLIKDYDSVLLQMDRVVRDVDRRPLQVAIEAMILSVRLTDQMDMGVDFEALKDNNHVRIVSGTPANSLDALNLGKGLKVGFLDSSLSVFVKALETVGDTNVIATPRILALNKMRAEILIGSQLGYVSTTVTETSTTQAVQFLEVGTQLRLRPFISSDGMIRMEVHPELSTGVVRTENGFTLPDKELTGVTTNIMARDGSTVIIGGLIREDLTNDMSQIPLLGSLPAVGALFRQKTEKTDRREIIVLITPRIVCDADMNREGNQGAMEFHHRQAIFGEKMSPFSRVHLCKKYIYLAQQAWGQGKQERALRLVNLAIQFDPENRSAIDLRSDIAAGIPIGNHTGQAPFIPPSEMNGSGDDLEPWVLDDLDPAAPKELPKPEAFQGASVKQNPQGPGGAAR